MSNIIDKEIILKFPDWLKEHKEFALEGYKNYFNPREKFRDVIESLEFENLKDESAFGDIESNFENKYKFVLGNSDPILDNGVIIKSLKDAIKENEDLIKPYLTKNIFTAKDSKFIYLSEALYEDGIFVYIPKNLEINLPIHLLKSVIKAKTKNYYKTLIVVETGSKLTIIDEYKSKNTDDFYLVSGVNDIYIKDNAQLDYIHLQNFDYNAFNFSVQRASLGKDAKLNLFSLSLGSQFSYENIRSYSDYKGSSVELRGLVLGNKEQVFQHETLQDHFCGNTNSNLHFEIVLNDKAESAHYGSVHIEKQALFTEAYQLIKNLLLSRKVKAEAIPSLEILADEVLCSHGVTIGPVNPEDLFYLMSRGFSLKEAEHLMTEGSIENIISKIENEDFAESLRNYVTTALEEK